MFEKLIHKQISLYIDRFLYLSTVATERVPAPNALLSRFEKWGKVVDNQGYYWGNGSFKSF